jgi:pimeloyl-ACP methyl ester carboxylesterase
LFHAVRPLVEFDTGPVWKKVHCPVLVIYGDKDVSSGPPEPLVAIIRAGLADANNPDVTVRVIAGADHSLCVRKEQAQPAAEHNEPGDPDFVPGYLDLMTDWLARRFPTGP